MLDELKNYLDITWDDEKTNEKIAGILERAKKVLSSYAGVDLDFSDLSDRQLLFDCCRYIRSNAYEEFKDNYSAELIMLRAKYAVSAAQNKGDGDENAEN